LSTRARSAIRKAIRLDALEAPQRELEQSKKEVDDANAAGERRAYKQGGLFVLSGTSFRFSAWVPDLGA
jgi:hypothetical protein